jgi:hypothetical protein
MYFFHDLQDPWQVANIPILNHCGFLQEEKKYLGFVINQNGISPDKDKVKVIRSLKTPSTVKEVRSFIGMTSFIEDVYQFVLKLQNQLIPKYRPSR